MKRVLPSGFSRAVPVGKGAFGTVFRARQDSLGRWVALKEVPRGDKNAIEEAQALAAAPLACLPTVYGFVSQRRSEWISMEYIHGISLREAISQGLEAYEAAFLARALAESLAQLHQADRAHGDLKPENLIVEASGKIRLVDLGFSASISQDVPGGTAGYMAPERGTTGCDPRRADLWSLGVVLHEILVGARPTPAEGSNGWKRLRMTAVEWVPWIDLLLREDPARRGPCANQIDTELPEVGSPPVHFLERVGEQADRNLARLMVEEASALLQDGLPSEALAMIQQALELDPDQSDALGLLPKVRLGRQKGPRRWWPAVVVVLLLVGMIAYWALHRPRAPSVSVKASLMRDSGFGERVRGPVEPRNIQALPLREGRGVSR